MFPPLQCRNAVLAQSGNADTHCNCSTKTLTIFTHTHTRALVASLVLWFQTLGVSGRQNCGKVCVWVHRGRQPFFLTTVVVVRGFTQGCEGGGWGHTLVIWTSRQHPVQGGVWSGGNEARNQSEQEIEWKELLRRVGSITRGVWGRESQSALIKKWGWRGAWWRPLTSSLAAQIQGLSRVNASNLVFTLQNSINVAINTLFKSSVLQILHSS